MAGGRVLGSTIRPLLPSLLELLVDADLGGLYVEAREDEGTDGEVDRGVFCNGGNDDGVGFLNDKYLGLLDKGLDMSAKLTLLEVAVELIPIPVASESPFLFTCSGCRLKVDSFPLLLLVLVLG